MSIHSAYSRKLADPRWQKKRNSILDRDHYKCQYCNDTQTELQVHHLKYTGEPHEAPDEDLITLCADCHYIVTDLRKNWDEKTVKAVRKVKLEWGYSISVVSGVYNLYTYRRENGKPILGIAGISCEVVEWAYSKFNPSIKTHSKIHGLT